MSVINEETASVGIVGGADATHDCKLKHMLTAAANNNNNDNNIDFEKLTCECKNQMEAKKAVLGQHMGKASAVMKNQNQNLKQDNVFTLKRWNLVTMWSWDVECEVCAICRTPLMDSCLKCQTDNKHDDCVVVWGDCNHSFHNCCMSQWIKSRNLCPLCQTEWHVQRIGR